MTPAAIRTHVSSMSTTTSLRALAERGLFPPGRVLAEVGEMSGQPQVITSRVAGGLDVEVLPGRGFDVGDTRLGGVPLSWCSPVRDLRPLDRPRGAAWIDRFAGGLLTTCGPEHIGAADADRPMHGTFHHRPARVVLTRAASTPASPHVELVAVIDVASVFGASLQVTRRVVIDEGSGEDLPGGQRGTDAPRGRLRMEDQVHNLGPGPVPVAMLYHVNLGAPLVVPGTRVEVTGASCAAREHVPAVPDPRRIPNPVAEVVEAVFAHEGPQVDSDGRATAVITSPSGAEATVRWSAATLPHAYTWVFPTRGRWALGVEPSTAPLFTTDGAPSTDAIPLLEEGDTRAHTVDITASW